MVVMYGKKRATQLILQCLQQNSGRDSGTVYMSWILSTLFLWVSWFKYHVWIVICNSWIGSIAIEALKREFENRVLRKMIGE